MMHLYYSVYATLKSTTVYYFLAVEKEGGGAQSLYINFRIRFTPDELLNGDYSIASHHISHPNTHFNLNRECSLYWTVAFYSSVFTMMYVFVESEYIFFLQCMKVKWKISIW